MPVVQAARPSRHESPRAGFSRGCRGTGRGSCRLVGTGKRLFADGTPGRAFELTGTTALASGIVVCAYELGEPLPGAEHYLRAEVLYAATHEGARHLDDVLARRTRVSIETFDRGVAAARPAAELMAEALGWDDAQVEDEVDHYLRRVEAERQSQLMPTDQEADEARVKAPDIV